MEKDPMAPEEAGPDYEELQRFARLAQENERRLKDGRRLLCARCLEHGREPEELVPKPHPKATPGVAEYMECPRDGFALLVPLALRRNSSQNRLEADSALMDDMMRKHTEVDERPRQPPSFLAHHDKQITEDIVRRLIHDLAPIGHMATPSLRRERGEEVPKGSEEWEAEANRLLEVARRNQFYGVTWSYPFHREQRARWAEFHIMFRLPDIEHGPEGKVKSPHPAPNDGSWLMVSVDQSNIAWWRPEEMSWFLEKCMAFAEFFEADFACAELKKRLFLNLEVDDDPAAFAWPLMLFGPERAKKIGHDKLLDAPAWKVEELPYGGIWVQVWENPFDVPQKQVTTLAKYLGLEARR